MLPFKKFNLVLVSFLLCDQTILPDSHNKQNLNSNSQKVGLTQEVDFEREAFESLMTLSREHTQNIGFCIQQILQTLSSNKEQIKIHNKKEVIKTLEQLQDVIEMLIQDTYSKNTKNALTEGIVFTNGIMHFLLNGLKTDFNDFDTKKLIAQIQKKSALDISDETMHSLAKKNTSMVKELIYASDRMGLTWCNLAYRKFKDTHGYSIIKNGAIVSATVILAGWILNNSTFIEPNGGFWHRWIGTTPRQLTNGSFEFDTKLQKTVDEIKQDIETYQKKLDPSRRDQAIIKELLAGQEFLEKNPQEKTVLISAIVDKPETIFQSLSKCTKSLQSSGIITIGALCTVSISGITEYLLGDWYQKGKLTGEKTLDDLDKLMTGSKANKALNADGQEKVYFKDLVGCEELETLAKKIANFIKHPERYERAQIEEHRGILLYGPPQTGKSLFAKALRTLIDDTLGSDRKMGFIDGKKYLDYGYSLSSIFKAAEDEAPCILFFDEIDLIGTNREKDPKKTGQLLTCMQGIDISSKQIIVIGATNRIEQLDKALLVDGRFGKKIFIGYPDYNKRKAFLERELAKRSIKLSAEFIDHIAQETENCSYNNLRRIITEAIILSANETRPIGQADFERTLDTEVRKIDRGTRASSSKEEKEIIATYQAGKAVTRHVLQTKQEVVKITIENVARTIKSGQTGIVVTNSDSDSSENEKLATNQTGNDSKIKLGELFTKSTTNSQELISDEETKKECLALLAGGVAQQIMLGSSFSQCNKHDRAEVMQMIYAMISHGEKIDDKVRAKALRIKKAYEDEVRKILEDNKDLLLKIINELIEKITIDRYDWAKIITK
jgi:cell division protease FtsH